MVSSGILEDDVEMSGIYARVALEFCCSSSAAIFRRIFIKKSVSEIGTSGNGSTLTCCSSSHFRRFVVVASFWGKSAVSVQPLRVENPANAALLDFLQGQAGLMVLGVCTGSFFDFFGYKIASKGVV